MKTLNYTFMLLILALASSWSFGGDKVEELKTVETARQHVLFLIKNSGSIKCGKCDSEVIESFSKDNQLWEDALNSLKLTTTVSEDSIAEIVRRSASDMNTSESYPKVFGYPAQDGYFHVNMPVFSNYPPEEQLGKLAAQASFTVAQTKGFGENQALAFLKSTEAAIETLAQSEGK